MKNQTHIWKPLFPAPEILISDDFDMFAVEDKSNLALLFIL